jgi:uncharacterized protein (TIGR02266 family)
MSEREDEGRRAERASVEAEVRLEFESFQGFLSEYSANISTGGMFVRSQNPPSVGSIVRFSLQLKGNFRLIQGRGEVVWARQLDGGPLSPPGMGIRFIDLPPSALDLLRKIVERHREQGGRPFDLNQGRATGKLKKDTESTLENLLRGPVVNSLVKGAPTADPDGEPEIFLPPAVAPAGPPSVPGKPSPVAMFSADANKPPPVRWTVLVPVIIVSLITGALLHRYGEVLVHWATGFDAAQAERVIYDIPPEISLEADRVRDRAERAAKDGSAAAAATEDAATGEPSAAGVAQPGTDRSPDLGAGSVPATELAEEDVDPSGLLGRIRLITWKQAPEGDGTIVTLWGDGQLLEERLVHVRFGDRPPRELLKLRGVNWPFRDPVIDVATAEVRRIRTGFHRKESLNELHVVVDLMEPSVRLKEVRRGPRNIELVFQR